LFCLNLVAALTPRAFAQDRPIVAVFQIEDKSGKLSAKAIDQLTDYLGTLMATRGFQVVPRSQLKARLLAAQKASYQQACDESCQIELGKELAAQKSLAAQVLKIGSQCKVTLNLFDLKKAASEAAGMASGGCAEDHVVTSLDQAVAAMLGGAAPEPAPSPGLKPAPDEDLVGACDRPLEPEEVERLAVTPAALKPLATFLRRRAAAGATDQELGRQSSCLAFLRLEEERRAYRATPLLPRGVPLDKGFEKKLEVLKDLTRRYQGSFARSVPFWQVAGCVRIGELAFELATALIESPAPRGLSSEEAQLYSDQLQDFAAPFEQKAIEFFQKALALGREHGAQNGWTRRAQDALHKLGQEPKPEPVEAAKGAALEWILSRPAGIELTKTEVTVGQFRACVEAGKCSAPKTSGKCNWGGAGKEAHPVNCVDWNQATAFCAWAGGRLPTEQEWEAEASDSGKRLYPWGNEPESCELTIWSQGGPGCGQGGTSPVCSKPAGNSVSGLCDMSGNVWEWTSSSEGAARVARGGSWRYDHPGALRASGRYSYPPESKFDAYGYRCARAAQ